MKKKLVSALLCATMAATLLSGCGGGSSNTADDSNNTTTTQEETTASDDTTAEEPTDAAESVTVKLGIWPEDTQEDEIAMHEGFVEKMKNINPNVEYVPAYYKYATDTFMPMVEGGTCPTVFETWFTETQKLINSDAVADITKEMNDRGWTEKMTPGIKQAFSDASGNVYGIPRDAYALGLMCNVELFEEAGLVDADGIPQYPKTWDELAETAKTIKDKTGAAGLCLLAKDGGGGWHWSNIAWDFGATLVTENGDGTYTSHLDSDEAIAAMNYIKDLKWKYDVLTADPTNEDWGTGFTQLGTGGAAMYIAANDAVNQPTYVNGLPVDKLALFPIPAGPGGQYLLQGGTPYMFAKNATEAEINAALDYLEVMGKAPVVSDDTKAGWEADYKQKNETGVPVIPRFPCWSDEEITKAEQEVIDKYSNVDMRLYQDYFDMVGTDALRTEEPGDTQAMYSEITKVLQEVITNKDADVAALMKSANDNYQQILDDEFKAN